MYRRLFLAFLAVIALAAPAAAQGRRASDFGYSDVQPLDRILPAIRNGRPGRFYDADGPFADGNGGLHYRIKWLTPDGRVVWLDADARTGRVLGPYHDFAPGRMMPPSGLRPPPGPRGFGRGWFGFRPGRRWGGH
jgi:hypothetical protein